MSNSATDITTLADFGGPAAALSQRTTLAPQQWGMITFLVSEAAFFSTLLMAYVAFMGADQIGPTPAVLSLSLTICTTICLLSSSFTVHLAEQRLRSGDRGAFIRWWALTIALGALFLTGTAYEWYGLITREHLTISRNLFGTTYYTLVGFHALHVTAGLIAMLIMLNLALRGAVTVRNRMGVEMISWYWHFVDGVWVVVFTLVYLIGR